MTEILTQFDGFGKLQQVWLFVQNFENNKDINNKAVVAARQATEYTVASPVETI